MRTIHLVNSLFLYTMIHHVTAVHASDSALIRDIHGPRYPDGVPPFALSAIVIVVAFTGLLVRRAVRKRESNSPDTAPPIPVTDVLQTARRGYELGQIPVTILFDRIATILRTTLVPGDNLALTNTEIIAIARLSIPRETACQTAALLDLCDQVRFGSYHPPKETVLKALDDGRSIVEGLTENRA